MKGRVTASQRPIQFGSCCVHSRSPGYATTRRFGGQDLPEERLTETDVGLGLFGVCRDVLQALFGAQAPTLETVFDGLAAGVARYFDPGVLDALIA